VADHRWQADEDVKHGLLEAKRERERARTQHQGTATGAADSGAAPEGDRWFDAWEASRVARGLTATRDNRVHYTFHIRPALGAKHVRDWTPEDMRTLVRALDAKVSAGDIHWKYAKNVWGTATKMASDAISSKIDALRVRTHDPCAGVEGPDTGNERSKQFLYPSEFLRFVSCEDVPLTWRVAVAQAIYLFPRDGEHRVLRWTDVDLGHGVISITRAWNRRAKAEKATKTKQTRRFNIEPNLLPLLRALHSSDSRGLLATLASERNMARGLRHGLKQAGVDRAELHTTTATTKAMTWHDLRATGLTWMAVRGDDPLKIGSCRSVVGREARNWA
jgi:integrase